MVKFIPNTKKAIIPKKKNPIENSPSKQGHPPTGQNCLLKMTFLIPLLLLIYYNFCYDPISMLSLKSIHSISHQSMKLNQEKVYRMCVPTVPSCLLCAAIYYIERQKVLTMLFPPTLALCQTLVMTEYNPG